MWLSIFRCCAAWLVKSGLQMAGRHFLERIAAKVSDVWSQVKSKFGRA